MTCATCPKHRTKCQRGWFVSAKTATTRERCLTHEIATTRSAALSHSWESRESSKKPVPKTNSDNIHSRKDGIPWQELTKAFEDGIITTRRLGLGYIWIDAMCIVQDDKEGWILESSRMALNYQNAHVVIAATRSHTGDDGCFFRTINKPQSQPARRRRQKPHRVCQEANLAS